MIDDLTDLDTVPAIAMTQWRAGRVLDDKDVAMIAALLDEQDRIEADATEAFHRAGLHLIVRRIVWRFSPRSTGPAKRSLTFIATTRGLLSYQLDLLHRPA